MSKFRIIKNKIKSLYLFSVIIINCLFYRKRIYLLGIPYHGNLGDHAIAIAEEKFLNDNFPNYKVINISTQHVIFHQKLFKRIIGKSMILYTGGGFLGSLWFNEEEMFRKVLNIFPNNKIVVLPQTFYFSDDKEGRNILADSIKIYSSHKNLHLICREKFSFMFMKENFKEINIYLAPDMVLYMDKIMDNNERKDILFCMRTDKEKVVYNIESIIESLKECGYNLFFESNTVLEHNVYPYNRSKMVCKKIHEFSKYELIVTDRLHGMIFAYLSNTPCIVLSNKSYKIDGVYEWMDKCDYVKLTKKVDKNLILYIIKTDKSYKFNKDLYNNIVNILSDV